MAFQNDFIDHSVMPDLLFTWKATGSLLSSESCCGLWFLLDFSGHEGDLWGAPGGADFHQRT